MPNRFYKFKNNGDSLFNDQVFPGAPNVLDNFNYSLNIIPRSSFWRLGLRFGQTENIEFFHPDQRYYHPTFEEKYVDVNICAGEKTSDGWEYPNRLILEQYNLPNILNPIKSTHTYTPGQELEFSFVYNSGQGTLFVHVAISGSLQIETSIKLPPVFKFFKVFAWADGIDYEVDCTLHVDNVVDDKTSFEEIDSFQVGNIIFRFGDMFQPQALNKADLLILPAGAEGTAAPNILNRASELNIPYPSPNKLGGITLYKIPDFDRPLYAGYGYSFSQDYSSLPTIEYLCQNLLVEIYKEGLSQNISCASLPMLGLGTGNVSALEIAHTFDAVFNTGPEAFKIIVSIPNRQVFTTVILGLVGQATNYEILIPEPKLPIILELENELGINIETFQLSVRGSITALHLNLVTIPAKTVLSKFTNLEALTLYNCDCQSLSFLQEMPKLHSLYLNGTRFRDLLIFKQLTQLSALDLSGCRIPSLDFLQNCGKLNRLYIRSTGIQTLDPLTKLSEIQFLDASGNGITSANKITSLSNLQHLVLSYNSIDSIKDFENLVKLEVLDVSHNRIWDLEPLQMLSNLSYLKVDNNPFVENSDLILDESENHLGAVLNALELQNDVSQIDVCLPAKILILGNHSSGKTSLLQFIKQGIVLEKPSSTHVINIEQYHLNDSKIPSAIFFDFGGQDYYHGIYRAFLSGGAAYLIIWNSLKDTNLTRRDINEIVIQDFTLRYWIGQKEYLEQQKYNGVRDPALIIQTFADTTTRTNVNLPNDDIQSHFFVSLEKSSVINTLPTSLRKRIENSNCYLRQCIEDLIEERIVKTKKPEWYKDFLEYILSASVEQDHQPKNIRDLLPYYSRKKGKLLDALKQDLDQLHKQGLILYYRDLLPDIIWLNPVALTSFIHSQILKREIIQQHKGRLDKEVLKTFDTKIIDLLVHQKVIFNHPHGKNGEEYIVPNYLPLFEEDQEADLFTFDLGSPRFVIKFSDFLPFGMMNQIISFFGQLPKRKKFWRDQLLFSFNDKAKVLIAIDFKNLEINVYCSFISNCTETYKNQIVRYLFFGILAIYWDFDVIDFGKFNDFDKALLKKDDLRHDPELYTKISNYEALFEVEACRPRDLFLSINSKHFISYKELCNSENDLMINAIEIDENHTFSDRKKIIPSFPFQTFTKRILRKRKKVTISYSKKDLPQILKFAQYLTPLYDLELIDQPWFCTLLEPGEDWDSEIKSRFETADIVIFMISENMMSTQYVKEHEIKNAIDRYDEDQSVRIIPISLVPYNFTREGKYNLARFSALPFMLKPVNTFINEHVAWYCVSEFIRLMLQRQFDPGRGQIAIPNDIQEYLKQIVTGEQLAPIV